MINTYLQKKTDSALKFLTYAIIIVLTALAAFFILSAKPAESNLEAPAIINVNIADKKPSGNGSGGGIKYRFE